MSGARSGPQRGGERKTPACQVDRRPDVATARLPAIEVPQMSPFSRIVGCYDGLPGAAGSTASKPSSPGLSLGNDISHARAPQTRIAFVRAVVAQLLSLCLIGCEAAIALAPDVESMGS